MPWMRVRAARNRGWLAGVGLLLFACSEREIPESSEDEIEAYCAHVCRSNSLCRDGVVLETEDECNDSCIERHRQLEDNACTEAIRVFGWCVGDLSCEERAERLKKNVVYDLTYPCRDEELGIPRGCSS